MSEGYLIGPNLLGRIRRVVDDVEAAPMKTGVTRIETRFEGEDAQRTPAAKVFRVCTFTGANVWGKDSDRVVTFKYQTATPNTVTAKNLLFDVAGPETSGASTAKVCIIGKEGTAWYFVNAEKEACESGVMKARELDPIYALDSSSTEELSEGDGPQVLVNQNGCVRWMSLTKIRVAAGSDTVDPIRWTGAGIESSSQEVFVLTGNDSDQILIEAEDCP